MNQACTFVLPFQCNRCDIMSIDRFGTHIALSEPYASPVLQIDRRNNNHHSPTFYTAATLSRSVFHRATERKRFRKLPRPIFSQLIGRHKYPAALDKAPDVFGHRALLLVVVAFPEKRT